MNTVTKKKSVEIWGGLECTINRVDNKLTDQLQLGNYYNSDYIDEIIKLGIKTIRFPILWEKHQSVKNDSIDWHWAKTQLEKLQQHGITPIAGLLHHGSGPLYTNLLQDDFAEQFAAYAAKVATQFPWINDYTPVNEPLTTARFSGLYGLWYPHKKNDVSFVKILLNQLKGTVLAMQQIRKINPAARLIQTEDLGKTYSTLLLAYQARFENKRRWLTYDILCGHFTKEHELWDYFRRLGIEEHALQFFINNPCVPDIIGVNHYVTSERYLDENTVVHHPGTHGNNSIHTYADVAAARVNVQEPHGAKYLLKEIWERYKIPIAITEVHLHCTREDQLRWFNMMYNIAGELQEENVDIRAITAWALLGSFGWNKLLTDKAMQYEPGVFDIHAGYARATALADFIKNSISKRPQKNFLLRSAGWWQLDDEYLDYKAFKKQPLLILGKTGTLGQAFARICAARNIYHISLCRNTADVCSNNIEAIIKNYQPWAIINATGYVRVDEAETNRMQCHQVNAFAVKRLATICEQENIKLVSFSTDLVFDGTKQQPYTEQDAPNPLNVYGVSKMLAESFVSELNPTALMIRTSAFFGPWDDYNFISTTMLQLQKNELIYIPDDIFISPTYVPHLADAALDLLIDDASGIWHLCNKGCISWYALAKAAAGYCEVNTDLIIPVSCVKATAKRPAFSALTSERYLLMPTITEGLEAYFSHKKAGLNF